MSILQANGAGLGGAGDPGGALAGGSVYPYTISQSLRLDGINDYLTKANFGTSTDTAKRTFSTWIRRSEPTGAAAYNHIIGAASSSIDGFGFQSGSGKFEWLQGGSVTKTGVRQFRDTAAWYHVFTTWNSTDNQINIFVNGELDYSDTGSISALSKLCNTGHTSYIGKRSNAGTYIDGYLAETVFLDGYIANVTDFGEYRNGIWVAKDISSAGFTYGTNGFYLTYKSSDLNTTGSNRTDPYGSSTDQPTNTFADNSGQGNHWTINGIDSTNIVDESPQNTFCSINPIFPLVSVTVNHNNLRHTTSTNNRGVICDMILPKSGGVYYWEHWSKSFNYPTDHEAHFVGINRRYTDLDANRGGYDTAIVVSSQTGSYNGSSWVEGTRNDSYGSTGWEENEGVGVVYDADNKTIAWKVNGGTTTTPIAVPDGDWIPFVGMGGGTSSEVGIFNFGQDGTFTGETTSGGYTDANGYGDFKWQPPTGALALCTANFPDPAIGPGADNTADHYFEAITYTGNGDTQHIGSGGLQHPQDTVSIANALRFNEDSSLHYDITSDGNKRTWTFSAWIKRTTLGAASGYYIFSDGQSSNFTNIFIKSDGKIYAQLYESTGPSVKQKTSTETFNKLDTWYHIVWRVDTTQSTDSDRSRVYVNGTQITAWDSEQHVDQNDETTMNVSGKDFLIGAYDTSSTSRHFAGYMAEINFVDGQSYGPEYFGQVGSNGYWVPKSLSGVSYGSSNNSFRLDFADSSALGDDESGNTNDFDTTDNIDSHDQVLDSPTQNFVTLGGVTSADSNGGPTHREGNLQAYDSSTAAARTRFQLPKTGKWYFETKVTSGAGVRTGVADVSVVPNVTNFMGVAGTVAGNYYINSNGTGASINADTGVALDGGNSTFSGTILTIPVGVFVNMDDKEISFQCDRGSGLETIGPFQLSHDELHAGYNLNGDEVTFNFGQDSTFAGNESTGGSNASDANSAGSFFYTVPTGALALMDDNIPVEGIDSPDVVWIKNRSNGRAGLLYDSIRGPNKDLKPNTSTAEDTTTNGLLSFDKQGFTVADKTNINGDAETIVAWCWKAGGVSNTFNKDGTGYSTAADAGLTGGDITPTGSSINTTAGFSIIRYTGNGTANQTIKHGLSQAPEMIWNKDRDTNVNNNGFWISSTAVGDNYAQFHTTNQWYSTAQAYPTSGDATTVTICRGGNVNNTNESGDDYIQYHWHSVEGFSSIGKYTGNGAADGQFVNTGFRPAWIMIKSSSSGSRDWMVYDNKRLGYNVDNNVLRAMAATAATEQTDDDIDILSNGFKLRRASSNTNSSGVTYAYLAFAETPFKFANAR